MNQAEYFQQHAVDGVLPPAAMAQLLVAGLPEGDTPAVKVGTDDPPVVEAAPTPAVPKVEEPTPPAPAVSPAPTPAPVILAKDGVHTIPFERLEEARRAEQAATARAAALAAEVEALKKVQPTAAAPAPTSAPAPATAEVVDFGDYSDDSLKKGVSLVAKAEAAQAVADAVAPLKAELESLRGKLGEAEKAKEVDATTAHWTAIYSKHPDLDSLVESTELDTWIKGQPTFLQPALRQTLEQGTAGQVIELFDTFKAATGKTAPASAAAPAAPSATAEAQAAAAIAAAQARPPTSLSEVPAGTQAHVDPNAALLQATPQQLMARMADMSPAEIEALVARSL